VIKPSVCAITSIGKDHVDVLGTTAEQVTLEKAGIVKDGAPVVCGPTVPAPTITQIGARTGSRVFFVDSQLDVEMENRAIVSRVLQLAAATDPRINLSPRQALDVALALRPRCRFEEWRVPVVPHGTVIKNYNVPEGELGAPPKNVSVVVDVAHNVPAVVNVIRRVKARFPDQRVIVVYGAAKDKVSDARAPPHSRPTRHPRL
jgi:dihydrofolate synthase/folylpolyglutamate synthase